MSRFGNRTWFQDLLFGLMAGVWMTFVAGCDSGAKPAVPSPPATSAPAGAPAHPGDAPTSVAARDPKGNAKVEVVGGETFDFGTRQVGEEMEHVYIIKNVGSIDLTIRMEKPSCMTCTSYDVDKPLVKPGESAKYTVKWHVKNENPEFSQYAPFSTNDPDKPMVKLFAKCQVLKRIVLEPVQVWNLGDSVEEKPTEFSATVTSAIVDQFQISEITTTNPELKVTSIPLSAAKLAELKVKTGYQLKAVLSTNIPIGNFTDKVTIKILAPEPLSLVVEANARRNGPLQIFGPNWYEERMSLSLGAFDPKEPLVARLNLFTRGVKGELKITQVTCPDERFTFEIKPDTRFKSQAGDHRRYELFVKVAASQRDAVYPLKNPLKVLIDTNQEQIGQIKLKVTASAIP